MKLLDFAKLKNWQGWKTPSNFVYPEVRGHRLNANNMNRIVSCAAAEIQQASVLSYHHTLSWLWGVRWAKGGHILKPHTVSPQHALHSFLWTHISDLKKIKV